MNARHALPDDFDVSRDRELLGAYLLDLADADEMRWVEHRLAVDADYRREMEELREMTDLLGEVPPEAFLDGPPDADLALQRALRRIRAEHAARRRWRLAEIVAVRAGRASVASVSSRPGPIHPDLAPGTATCPGG